MEYLFESERLLYRRLKAGDVEDMFELDSDPEVHKYLGNNPIQSREQALGIIVNVCGQYEEFGVGRVAVIEKVSGNFLGWSGLKYETVIKPDNPYYDLGYRFKKKHWGKGFATESGRASLLYGFNEMKLDKICAAAHHSNEGSIHVIKKLAFTRFEDFMFEDIRCLWFELEQKDFLNHINQTT